MRQIWITKYGAPGVLEIQESFLPSPGPGEVSVAVKAAGVNFADIMARKGLYPDAPKPPFVVGYEVAGTVEALGAGVEKSWAGKSVFALTRFGGYSELVNVPLGQVFEKPKSLSFNEAAALPVNYLTAWQLVMVMGGLRKGETVLIHNAGGGVGLAAVQIAKHIGAFILGTASDSKHYFLKAQGVDQCIDYRAEEWERMVLSATQGKGVDLILDPMGGPFWKKNLRLLGAAGRLGAFGVSTLTRSKFGRLAALIQMLPHMPVFNVLSLMNRNCGVFGVNLGHLWGETQKVRGWIEAILAGVKEGWIKPRVNKSFPFDEVSQAHRYLEERRNRGKVLLIP
jgi:NADPH:quinone reductase-like Zn-dependent oxidoreductase